jgi:hypothetical protein
METAGAVAGSGLAPVSILPRSTRSLALMLSASVVAWPTLIEYLDKLQIAWSTVIQNTFN